MRKSIGCVMAGLLVAALAAGCGAAKPSKIVVINDSDTALKNVLVHGKGFSTVIARIPAHDTGIATVMTPEETSATLEVDTPIRRVVADNLGYFEKHGGYKLSIRITEDFNVEHTLSTE